ncbi:MAG TPA: DUF4190 domain-containing protein [Stackebrandtia sp.]|jgi:hypothetical protein|uniref:DUF4190 domain-containing protein n=1 Tax=Stackebrandtia sp. TaxID=2023065 RepID=UPI002D3B5077|nr:DUF4190 domain-containing protein [Stackebrandtia sp.]HZE39049.1 DUF4190 domain-containing protein [Stackebrandtia sp.]
MTNDPRHYTQYDPTSAPPVFEQPTTDAGSYYQQGYPDGATYQQQGYPAQNYAAPVFQSPMPYRAPENGLGIAALILGILGVVSCIACAIPAIICGHMGVKKADRGEADNRGMALAGLICGYVGLALWGIVIIIYIVFALVLYSTTSNLPTSPSSPY